MDPTRSTGLGDSVHPDDASAEEALGVESVAEGEPISDADAPFPDEADAADVLEQRDEVPPDEDDEAPDA